MGIVWENKTPSTELTHDFCAGIGPLQLGVVFVIYVFNQEYISYFWEIRINYVKVNTTERTRITIGTFPSGFTGAGISSICISARSMNARVRCALIDV